MHERFLQYLRFKKMSRRSMSLLSGVSASNLSRFCNGNSILSDNLLKLLQVCDDLSLEWFFYGTGSMIRSRENINNYYGRYVGGDVVSDGSLQIKNSSAVKVSGRLDTDLEKIIIEKDRIILQKDRIISDRDETIRRLLDKAAK